MNKELEARFGNAARGRAVIVRFESNAFILALDYEVVFRVESNTFDVLLIRGGCFEGAYRCIEKVYEQFRSDLESAVAERVSWLECNQSGRSEGKNLPFMSQPNHTNC